MVKYRDKNMKPFWDHKENLDTFHKESLLRRIRFFRLDTRLRLKYTSFRITHL